MIIHRCDLCGAVIDVRDTYTDYSIHREQHSEGIVTRQDFEYDVCKKCTDNFKKIDVLSKMGI